MKFRHIFCSLCGYKWLPPGKNLSDARVPNYGRFGADSSVAAELFQTYCRIGWQVTSDES